MSIFFHFFDTPLNHVDQINIMKIKNPTLIRNGEYYIIGLYYAFPITSFADDKFSNNVNIPSSSVIKTTCPFEFINL